MNNGPGRNVEKAKNFKESIIRLFKELKDFKILLIISIILSILSSILSIMSPNRLSDLTDYISKGLIVNQKNIKEISKNINQDKLNQKFFEILNIDMSDKMIYSIISDENISNEDKEIFQNTLKEIGTTDKEKQLSMIVSLPNSILNKVLSPTVYKNQEILTSEKIELLKSINDKKIVIPTSIKKVLFDDVYVNKVKLTSFDQASFLELMSNTSKDDVNSLYKNIDKMPKNIKKLIKPSMNMTKIKSLALILVIIYILSALFTYIVAISMTTVSNKFAKNLRSRISIKINKLPLKYYDSHISGDILSRVTNDIDTIAQSMNQSLSTLVSALTLFLGSVIMMFITNWVMALTAIFSSLLGFIFMFKVLSKSQKHFVSKQKELGNLNGHIEEIYSGITVVKTYNGQEEALEKFDKYNKAVYDANRKSQFLSGLMMPMMNFIGNFGYVAVCIVGAILTMNDYISFGVIVAFILYVRLFTSPLSQIAQAFTSLQSTAAASERVFEFLDEEEMDNQKDINKILDKKKVKGEIEFKNVSFTYDGNDKATINNFSAKARPGNKIAIVGPTGAGKTTIVNLLMKFYEINSGEILIDGISTNKLSRENVHDLFTMVLQDTWLFNGTIKENIKYNHKNVSDKKVEEVCKIVGLDHFIKTLPHGYNSTINDNDSVSSGQRQLLTIARGMIKNSPFLILDEATSNVDTRTEELVQIAMDKLTKGKTSFIIAHRLSTIKNADLILVMKDGDIIESGNHAKLMKENGFYADLYNSQFKL